MAVHEPNETRSRTGLTMVVVALIGGALLLVGWLTGFPWH